MNRWALVLITCLFLLLPLCAWGEADLLVSGELFTVGEVVDLEIQDAKDATCVYTVWCDGVQIFNGVEPDSHLKASYRPRTAGEYEIRADLILKSGEKKELRAAFTVMDGEAEEEGLYSQRDGWWKDKAYRNSDLDTSGCAIFTLAHALQCMGVHEEAAKPEVLAKTYAACLVKGGTSNVRLIREASEAFVFQTKADLLESKNEIIKQFRDGSMFSFSIVFGHIALASDLSADGKKVEIIDSAPGVTLERIKNGSMYYLDDKGKYVRFTDLADVPGTRYYFETKQWGALKYYLDFNYVAGRGVRMIKPYWLCLEEDGESIPVDLEAFGTVQCVITVNKKSRTVPTSLLTWRASTETKLAAYIPGSKAVSLTDSAGKKGKSVPGRSVMPVLEVLEDKVQVRYDDTVGYLPLKSVELLDLSNVTGTPGVLSLNGNTSGRADIRVRLTPGGKLLDNFKTGTAVSILSEGDDTYEVEVDGRRGFVQKEYVTILEE